MNNLSYFSLSALLPVLAFSQMDLEEQEVGEVAVARINRTTQPLATEQKAAATVPANPSSAPPTPSQVPDLNYSQGYKENTLFAAMPYPNRSYMQMAATAELLLWTSGVNQLFGMATGSNLVPPGNGPYRKMISFDNHYSPGVRTSALFAFAAQGWDITTSWTHLLNQQTQNVNPPYGNQPLAFVPYTLGGNFFPELANANAQRNKMAWKFNYNNIDILFGKEFFISKYYAFHPRTGGRFVWLKDALQVLMTSTENGEFLEARIKNNYHGFGFTAGLDSTFLFRYGLSLSGSLDLGEVYGPLQIDSFTHQSQPGLSSGPYNFNQKSNNLFPFFDTKLNLAWKRSFYNEKTSLELFGGYEYHMLMNGFASLQSPTSGETELYIGSQSNLYFHGASFGMRVSF